LLQKSLDSSFPSTIQLAVHHSGSKFIEVTVSSVDDRYFVAFLDAGRFLLKALDKFQRYSIEDRRRRTLSRYQQQDSGPSNRKIAASACIPL
jgi:hypothetical protein